jgi:GNAT superfamily N-acetyltransferase
MNIIQARMPEHEQIVHDLFAEYLRWVCPKIYEEYRAVFDAEKMIVHDMETVDIFLPPNGILLLSFENETSTGCACTRTIGQKVAEMKRMYVRPTFRRQGIAAKLVQETIRQVRAMNYEELRLDSAGFMSGAHSVYHAAGFRDTSPYQESEIPQEYWQYWVFMKLKLSH